MLVRAQGWSPSASARRALAAAPWISSLVVHTTRAAAALRRARSRAALRSLARTSPARRAMTSRPITTDPAASTGVAARSPRATSKVSNPGTSSRAAHRSARRRRLSFTSLGTGLSVSWSIDGWAAAAANRT